jgi:ATP-dependent Lon protease
MEKVAKPQSGVSAEISELPVLPLRDVVVYPHMVVPLFVGREKSVRALETAMAGDKRILLVAQRSPDVDDPQAGDLYSIGTVATVLQCSSCPTARSRCWSRARAGLRSSMSLIAKAADGFRARDRAGLHARGA